MKKTLLSVVAVMSIIGSASAADTITNTDSLKNENFSIDARVFYFDRSFDAPNVDNATALTAGGIMKYISDDYKGFKAGIAYYGSHRIGGLYSKEEGVGTSNLTRTTGDDIALLGEAYLEYNMSDTMVKVGRQRLSTPLMNDHDLRLLPSAYEAAIVQNKSIANTTIEAGYVWSYTGFTSKDSDFLKQDNWGEDGLAYIYVANNSIKGLKVKAQYIMAISDQYDNAGVNTDISVLDYKYADAVYSLPFGKSSYIKAQYGGNAYQTGNDSTMYGAKTGTTVGMFDIAVLFNQITDNEFKAVEAGPMYSDWQQGYGNYEASTAFGGQIIVKPIQKLSVKAGYVDVSADEGNVRDDFTEINIDANYKINKISKIRVRYSIKDQTDESDREDRNDFRIIYYASF